MVEKREGTTAPDRPPALRLRICREDDDNEVTEKAETDVDSARLSRDSAIFILGRRRVGVGKRCRVLYHAPPRKQCADFKKSCRRPSLKGRGWMASAGLRSSFIHSWIRILRDTSAKLYLIDRQTVPGAGLVPGPSY
jgi:hypothetical protein